MKHELLTALTERTNRSLSQTEFLFGLCDNDFEKLKALEEQIKNCFLFYCPGDREAVEEVLSLTPKTNYFKL